MLERTQVLRSRGHDLLRSAAPDASTEQLRTTFARLWTAYHTPPRPHHTILRAVDVFEACMMLAQRDPATRRLDERVFRAALTAALYHGAVHDRSLARARQASALLAQEHLVALGSDAAVVTETRRLVLLTVEHAPVHDDIVGQLLCDAALHMLAAEPTAYAAYRSEVRAENDHLDDATWANDRSALLQGLLGRETIYWTEHARRAWEATARDNLTHELSLLAPGSGR